MDAHFASYRFKRSVTNTLTPLQHTFSGLGESVPRWVRTVLAAERGQTQYQAGGHNVVPDQFIRPWTCLRKGRAAVIQWCQEWLWESVWDPVARRCPHSSGPAEIQSWCWGSQCRGDQVNQTGDLHASGRWKPWWFALCEKHIPFFTPSYQVRHFAVNWIKLYALKTGSCQDREVFFSFHKQHCALFCLFHIYEHL